MKEMNRGKNNNQYLQDDQTDLILIYLNQEIEVLVPKLASEYDPVKYCKLFDTYKRISTLYEKEIKRKRSFS